MVLSRLQKLIFHKKKKKKKTFCSHNLTFFYFRILFFKVLIAEMRDIYIFNSIYLIIFYFDDCEKIIYLKRVHESIVVSF